MLSVIQITLCMLGNFPCFCCHLLTFFHNQQLIQKSLSGTLSVCQTVWIQIRPNILSVLIWVQTVCKDYQQTTNFTRAGRDNCHLLTTFENSLDTDQAPCFVGPDLYPICLTHRWYSWKIFWKSWFWKNQQRTKKHEKFPKVLWVSKQQRLWQDCANAQSQLSLHCLPMQKKIPSYEMVYIIKYNEGFSIP